MSDITTAKTPTLDWPSRRQAVLRALAVVSLPVADSLSATTALSCGVTLCVLTHAALVLAVLRTAWGWRSTLAAAGAVCAIAWAAESVGLSTGFPFGSYSYTGGLGAQLGGVPIIIPASWLMMLIPAWGVAARLVGTERRLAFIAVSAAAFTAWDLFLDPQMVAWNFWAWHAPAGYFGIPWTNFAGWFVVAALITAVVRPRNLPVRPLVIIYIVVWAIGSVGLSLVWSLPGPGLLGFTGMGVFVLLSWRRAAEDRASQPFVYTKKWAYAPVVAEGERELYDMEAGPSAERDLAAEYPDVYDGLHAGLLGWLKDIDAPEEAFKPFVEKQ